MNAAGIRALEQARGYYRGGVVSAEKRVKDATQALEEARIQLAHAEEQVAELDAAFEEASGPTGSDSEADLVEAIRLTVEYVGFEMLPPIEGWSWYDALRKHAPELADHFAAESERLGKKP